MSFKNILVLLIALLLLISPVISVSAFWHDKPPDLEEECTAFALKINGYGSKDSSDKIIFQEPTNGSYCKTFKLEVWVLNVEDLYAYDFTVWASDAHWGTVFELVDFKYEAFQDALWGKTAGVGNWYKIKPLPDYAKTEPYEQAVTCHKPGVPPAPGSYQLAELTFHFINDVCWCQEDIEGWFDVSGVLSNSCSGPICQCKTYPVWWRYIPVQPKVYLSPVFEENCVVGDTFTMKVMIANVTKMKSLNFDLRWYGNHIVTFEDKWIKILSTKIEDIVVNNALFPADKIETGYPIINLYDWPTGPSPYYDTSGIVFELKMKDAYPLINQTEPTWAVEITFKKLDPWYCGRQPDYDPVLPHEFEAENATTDIFFNSGYIDVKCPTLCNIYFGRFLGTEGSTKDKRPLIGHYICAYPFGIDKWDPCVADFDDALYIFDPVEGDLNGDGEVDMADLNIICKYYDAPSWDWTPTGAWSTARAYYYDLNDSGWPAGVDIYDVVIVAKHFGNKCTEHTTP